MIFYAKVGKGGINYQNTYCYLISRFWSLTARMGLLYSRNKINLCFHIHFLLLAYYFHNFSVKYTFDIELKSAHNY